MTQLLVYENAVPVNRERHRDWSVKSGEDYAFARDLRSVPLTAVEIPAAASDYVIVFVGDDDEVMPAAILGVREGESLYVNEQGGIDARYVPAFLRRYPFVFASNDEAKTFTLCIDESFSGCNQDGRGERLFDADGEQTRYVKGVLNFLQEYQAHFERTRTFCRRLKEMDLLQPMQAQLRPAGSEPVGLAGFMTVSREKLQELPADQLQLLARTGELELAYAHLQSLRTLESVLERMKPAAEAPQD